MHDDDCFSNPTGNQTLDEVVSERMTRRGLLGGGLAATAVTFLSGGAGAAALGTAAGVAAGVATASPALAAGDAVVDLVGFTPIPGTTADTVTVSPDYVASAVFPWGTPLFAGAPAWSLTNDAAAQEKQIGYNHDGMWAFDIPGSSDYVVCINHEYTDAAGLFAGGEPTSYTLAHVRKEQAAHGVSVFRARIDSSGATVVFDARNRRITARTRMTFLGPATTNRLMKTSLDPLGNTVLGTVNNCGSGDTEWGTYLTCEENFNGYFRVGEAGDRTPSQLVAEGRISAEQAQLMDRYGITGAGSYQWGAHDEAWRADLHPNQPNKFGWVVEIDPHRPGRAPTKLTALGRMKHESISLQRTADGRVAAYMGDDERGEYIYKFVSAKTVEEALAEGTTPLRAGTLHVARFDGDGTGTWLPLVHGSGPLTAANGFANQGEVLIKTRLAADALGATRMDRPEWTAVNHLTGQVFITLTNNSNRGVSSNQPLDRANPRAGNKWGHILRFVEPAPDASEFQWDILFLAGPGNGADGSNVPTAAHFGSPDGLWIDPDGRMFIQTDGTQPGAADGVADTNNQMLVADPVTRTVHRILVGPRSCEVTGFAPTRDRTALLVNIQHPGDGSSTVSTWPDGGNATPRPASVLLRRTDGGTVGS